MTNTSSFSAPTGPVVLCILDGWGERAAAADNAISSAATPIYDRLRDSCPRGLIDASAGAVGLPEGQMGNSEVGHLNIGAGRVVMQDLPRIDRAVADGSLAADTRLARFVARVKEAGGRAHLLGLLSAGGVHSHRDHMLALARTLHAAGLDVVIHAVLDGRDTPPRAADADLPGFLDDLGETARVVTVCGRFFAMDRDQRWERVVEAHRAIAGGDGVVADDPLAALYAARARDESDEFVQPSVVAGYSGMADGDGLLMANFRADRAREILTSLVDPDFDGFTRGTPPAFADRLGMVSYSQALDQWFDALFPPLDLADTLGEVVAAAGKRQMRIAETEKYPHVTFFLNGGREEEFAGETRVLIPSPKVKTYDLQPEMSAATVCDRLVAAIEGGDFDLIICNFANPDMVGHTGVMAAAVRAVETVDHCLGRLEAAIAKTGGRMLVTADHGNIEQMRDPAIDGPHTSHTTNLVPALLIGGPSAVTSLRPGRLADVAPTILALMGLAAPAVMTGNSLLVTEDGGTAAVAAE